MSSEQTELATVNANKKDCEKPAEGTENVQLETSEQEKQTESELPADGQLEEASDVSMDAVSKDGEDDEAIIQTSDKNQQEVSEGESSDEADSDTEKRPVFADLTDKIGPLFSSTPVPDKNLEECTEIVKKIAERYFKVKNYKHSRDLFITLKYVLEIALIIPEYYVSTYLLALGHFISSNALQLFTCGNWKILKRLGEGGFGQVFLAENNKDGTKCALKVIQRDDEEKEQEVEDSFQHEVSIMLKLTHPNIVQILEYNDEAYIANSRGESSPVYSIALELAGGGELFDFIALTGHFSEDIARFYFHQLCDALEYMHGNGISHRDLKPENIILNDDFKLKLADFGLASAKSKNESFKGSSIKKRKF